MGEGVHHYSAHLTAIVHKVKTDNQSKYRFILRFFSSFWVPFDTIQSLNRLPYQI